MASEVNAKTKRRKDAEKNEGFRIDGFASLRLCAFALKGSVLCSLLVIHLTALAEDWPQWRGPDGNGISKETGWSTTWPKEGPKQLWKAAVGIGFSSVTVANGRLFTMGNSNETDTVFCFEESSGKELWKHSYPCPLDPKYYEGGPGSSPTCEKDRVYTLSKR